MSLGILFPIVVAILAILAISIFMAFIWRRVVPTNMVHIVQSAKKTVSYGPSQTAGNSYYEIPSWVPRFGVLVSKFPESVFDVSLSKYEAYDIGRLPFVVDVQAFFRINDSQTAARRVSNFSELQTQLVGVLQGSVRRILATNTLEHIMQDRSTLGTQFTEEVNDQLQEWGVSTAKMIEFKDITDAAGSQVIHNMMAKEQSRIEKESRITVALNLQEAQTKEIEANREVQISNTAAQQQIGLREAEKDKVVGIAEEKSKQDVQAEMKITTEREMDVQKVSSVRQAEIEKEVAVVKAQQDQQVQVVAAEATATSQVKIADGNLNATLKDAEGIQAVGTAKAEAEKAMLLAPVNAQITLATEIGENQGYQAYLIEVRKIEANEAVGKSMAGALAAADVKVIANGGDVQSGLNGIGDLISPKGGTSLAGMVEGFIQTETGKALLEKVIAAPVAKTMPTPKKK